MSIPNNEKIETSNIISNLVLSCFQEIPTSCIGFGSYWQGECHPNSDIDFLILFETQPEIERINDFFQKINNLEMIPYPLSPQIFVGKLDDLVQDSVNAIRVLTMFSKSKTTPVVIFGTEVDLWEYFYKYHKNPMKITDEILFNTTRLFNSLLMRKDISKNQLKYKNKELYRIFQAIETIGDKFKNEQAKTIAVLLKKTIQFNTSDFLVEVVCDKFQKFNEIYRNKRCEDRLIAIIGADGVGKTTQTKLLEEKFRSTGLQAVRVKLSEIEDQLCLEDQECDLILENLNVSNSDENREYLKQCLIMRSKINKVVVPLLYSDNLVLMDRYIESMYGQRIFLADGQIIFEGVFKNTVLPHKSILLKMPIEQINKRIVRRDTNSDAELKGLEMIQQYFVEKFDLFDFSIVNGDQKSEDVTEDILKKLKE